MISGVQAVVLAVVAALPFTPPAGWVQLPQSAVAGQVTNVWKGPALSGGGRATFSAVAFPFPGTVEMLTSPMSTLHGSADTGAAKTISNTAIKLCGSPARMVNVRIGSGSKGAMLEQEVAVKNGHAYMLVYTRPLQHAADPAIASVMHAFCPSGTASVQTLSPPHGWTKTSDAMQIEGMWMGTQPGQILLLMRGSPAGSLESLLGSAQQQTMKNTRRKMPLKIVQQKRMTMCGYQGLISELRITAGPMPVTVHLAVTQGSGNAYALVYTQLGTAAADKNAVASLQTLCATGATPSLRYAFAHWLRRYRRLRRHRLLRRCPRLRPSLHRRLVVHRFERITVQVDDERGEVAAAIFLMHFRRTVVHGAIGHRARVEIFHRCSIARLKRNM